jgi:hypothetical protein
MIEENNAMANNLSWKSTDSDKDANPQELNNISDEPYDSFCEEVVQLNMEVIKDNDEDLSCETTVQLVSPDGHHVYGLGLLDTGATSAYVMKNFIACVPHELETATMRVQGWYASITTTHIATFSMKLIDFAGSKTVTLCAYVEKNAEGRATRYSSWPQDLLWT